MGKRSQEDSLVRMAVEARLSAQRAHGRAHGLRVETERIRAEAAALRKRCLNDCTLLGATRRN